MSDRERVIQMRNKGLTRAQIATACDLTLSQVNQAIETTILELRDGAPLLVEEMYHVHHERLEALFQLVQSKIDKMDPDVFDLDLFKAALSILERQAKLHGLDHDKKNQKKTRVGATDRGDDWLDNATPAELIHEAESYGLNVPEKFKLVD